MRKSFVLHLDSLTILKKMTNEMAGEFFKIIYDYQISGELPEMNLAMEMAVTPFINQFSRDNEKYLNKVETNKLNGSKGGKRKVANATEKKRSQTKVAYNKSDNDSDNKNESKSDLDIALNDFLEMRVKIKKPATERAVKLILSELEKLSGGDDGLKIKILEQSIKFNWQDVYELKNKTHNAVTQKNTDPFKGMDNKTKQFFTENPVQ